MIGMLRSYFRNRITDVARERASEPRERSAPAQRRARERVGESEGRSPSGCKTRPPHIAVTVAVLLVLGLGAERTPVAQEPEASIDNNQPFRNPAGHVATFSTQGLVDFNGEYFKPQGTNGRSCVTCHVPQDAWSITPGTIQRMFDDTAGTHPIFRPLDANNLAADFNTIEGREAAYSML